MIYPELVRGRGQTGGAVSPKEIQLWLIKL